MAEYQGPEYGQNLGRESDDTPQIGKTRTILNWIFFGIGVIMTFGSFSDVSKSPKALISILLFAAFTALVMPINQILKIWDNLMGKKWKIFRPIILIVVFFTAVGILPPSDTSGEIQQKEVIEEASQDSDSSSKTTTEENTDDKAASNVQNDIEKILGKDAYSNFTEAAEEISMDIDSIDGFEQIEDWASGPRYSFTYSGQQVLLYMLETNFVDGINTGGWQVYKDGLEPLNINDFIVDSGIYSQLQVDSEDAVKGVLNHPNTADFDWWTTGACSRAGQYYIISAQVKAQNSFGVEDTISFKTEYKVTDDTYSRIYFECDGAVVSGTYVEPLAERGEADSKLASNVSDGGFVLTDGQLGDYGQWYDQTSGIIIYYVPEGTYTVTALNKGKAFVSLPDDDENCDVYTFDKAGDVQTITIPKGNVVQLMLNTSLQFEPQ